MKKTTVVSALVVVLLIAGAIAFFVADQAKAPVMVSNHLPGDTTEVPKGLEGKNYSFAIEGNNVTLVNGISKVPAAPGSASMVTTRYFGNEATGDLNGDGLDDIAFLVTQDSGGSGLFYYAVVALKTQDGYKTTNAFLVGDRIAPQSTEIHTDSKELHVNYAERKPDEPMTAQPSQGAVLLLKVTPSGVLEGLMK